MPENYNQTSENRLALPAIEIETVKKCLNQAIGLLESSWELMHRDNNLTPTIDVSRHSLFQPIRNEIVTLCASPKRYAAWCLAEVVTKFAIERNTPTLVVTGNYSSTLLAVNLLLMRAEINLADAVYPTWGMGEFDRLINVNEIIARAPLHFAKSMEYPDFKEVIYHAVSNLGTQCVVLDDSTVMSVEQLLEIRSLLPMAIQFIGGKAS